MRLAELVDVAAEVAASPARRRKVALLADLLRRLRPDEVGIGAGFLAGEPRQGRVGVGWQALERSDPEPAARPTLELAQVDEELAALAALAGPGSQRERRARLERLLGRATRTESQFLRALLLVELRQGAAAGLLMQAMAVAWGVDEALVRRAVMLSADVGEVAHAAATGGEQALAAIRLRLLRPVRPMLASTAASLEEALAGSGSAVVEWKLDGARVQAHKAGDEVRVFTRSLRDVTAESAAVVAVVRALGADRLVLDGEVLALRSDGRPEAFQDSMRRGASLTPFFFDVLHADGVDLLDAPLSQRRAVLERLVPERHRVPGAVVTAVAEAERVVRDALERGHEGVMVKSPDATYEAGRRGAAWRKVKPVHTLDLVVLAVEWGSGRRRGWLSNLHLGARDPAGGFVMLGKTFKGLSDALLEWQTRELLARATERTGSVVHVRPELVVEVAFDGLQSSPRYPGGVALRFARVRRYRDDKSADEADTIETVRRLYAAGRRSSSRHREDDASGPGGGSVDSGPAT
jgi:DNA ligase 1